VSSGTLNSTIP